MHFKGEKCLVTGASGFVGAAVARALAAGHRTADLVGGRGDGAGGDGRQQRGLEVGHVDLLERV